LEKYKEAIDVANIVSEGDINIGKFSRIRVEFDNIKINTDYQLVEGMVETSYDANWSNVESVDEFINDIEELFNAISELLQNYTGTEEEVSLLQELNQKRDTYIAELISSPHITAEIKNELLANQEVYKTVSNDLIAESTGDNGYDVGSGMAGQVMQRNSELRTSIAKAEDEIFLGEAQRILNNPENSVAFWETIEKLEEIHEFLQQCNSEDWESYQDKGIVPYCLWRDAEVANENLYSGGDIPYLSGLVDGVYIEVNGVLKLPQLLKDLGSGMHQLLYSFTVAYIECNPMAMKVNRERLNKLLETVEVPDERKGLLDWMKEELDKFTVDDEERQEQIQQYLDKCKGYADTRQAVEDFFEFITDWEELKTLFDQVSEKLRETLEVYSSYSFVNEERYEKAVLDVQILSIATGIGAVTKIKKVKDILIGLRNFTKAQWDDLGRRFGRNGNLFSKFGQKLDEIGELLENGLVKGKYSGRVFNPNNAGGAIKSLDWENAIFTKSNIEIVKKHLGRLESDPWNDAMIKRLEDIEGGKIVPTNYDKKFINHEIGEFERYKELGYENTHYSQIPEEVWNNAHSATLEDYSISDYIIKPDGMRDYQLYHPDVQQIPE
tara:strand:- start:144323 stop:146152 length:1830 start_codon:yes stop_codon:yes gene_type:complete